MVDVPTVPNLDNYTDNLTNLVNDTFYKPFEVFFNAMGGDVFWTIMFAIIGIGILIYSKGNQVTLVIYLLAVDVFCAVLVIPIALMIFGFITAFIGGGLLYKALVSKR